MTVLNETRIGLPTLFALFVAVVLLFPLIRQRRRLGTWAVVARASSGPVERFVRWWGVALLVGVTLWVALVAVLGLEPLGVWVMPAASRGLGLALATFALFCVATAQAQMGRSWRIGIDDAPTELVTAGLYRYVRHPIYTGMVAILAALWLLTPTAWTLAVAVLGYLLVGVQSRLEDEHLRDRHGARFDRWAASTGRLLPRVGRWRSESR